MESVFGASVSHAGTHRRPPPAHTLSSVPDDAENLAVQVERVTSLPNRRDVDVVEHTPTVKVEH